MKKQIAKLMLVGVCGCWLAGAPHVAAGQAVSGLILSEVFEARGLAMGDAQVAVDDVTAVQINPAAASGLATPRATAFMKPAPFGRLVGSLGYVRPFKSGAIAGSVTYQTLGDVDFVTSSGQQKSINAGTDIVLSVGYGAKLYQELKGGLSVKYLSSKLGEQYSASAVMLDMGAIVPLAVEGAVLGVALRNLGTGLEYLNVSEKLPAEVRGGVSYTKSFDEVSVLVAMDAIHGFNTDETGAGMGVEVGWKRMISGRVGYRSGADLKSIVLGLGFSWQGVGLDYAVEPQAESFGMSHGMSLTYRFGAERKE